MGKKAFDAKRGTIYRYEAKDLIVVGIDVPVDDENRGLYDPKVEDKIDPTFAESIHTYGAIVPVVIVKYNDQPYVLDGRTRVRAQREIDPTGIVQAIVVKVDALTAEALSGVLNIARKVESLMDKSDRACRTAERLGDVPASEKQAKIALLYGVTDAAARQWLKLGEASARVRRAVDSGEISGTAALAIITGSDSAKAQDEALAQLLADAADGKKPSARRAAKVADDNDDDDESDDESEEKPAKGKKSAKRVKLHLRDKKEIKRMIKRVEENKLRFPTDVKINMMMLLEWLQGSDLLDEDGYPDAQNDKLLRTITGRDKE